MGSKRFDDASSNGDDSGDGWFDDGPVSGDDSGDSPASEAARPVIRRVPTPKESSGDGWFDEPAEPVHMEPELAEDVIPEWPDDDKPARKRRSGSSGKKAVTGVAVLGGLFVLVAGVGWAIVQSFGGDEPAGEALPAAASESLAAPEPAQSAAPAAPTCEESSNGDVVTGSGTGDTDSVAGVVLAFENAYYNDRDAKKAVDLTSKDSPFRSDGAVTVLQDGIDSVPSGTEHCVRVEGKGEDATVTITETAPDGEAEEFVQKITTTRDDGKVQIVAISEEES